MAASSLAKGLFTRAIAESGGSFGTTSDHGGAGENVMTPAAADDAEALDSHQNVFRDITFGWHNWAWANLQSKTDDPNGDGLPHWPNWTAESPRAMHFNEQPEVGGLANARQIHAIDGYFSLRRRSLNPSAPHQGVTKTMKQSTIATAATIMLGLTWSFTAISAPRDKCTSLAGTDVPATAIGLPTRGATISEAKDRPAADGLPDSCVVIGEIKAKKPNDPPIRFEVNLPSRWNGKAIQLGGGGFDGDMATGAEFGKNETALMNYLGEAVKRTRDTAAVIIQRYYGKPAHRMQVAL